MTAHTTSVQHHYYHRSVRLVNLNDARLEELLDFVCDFWISQVSTK